MLGNIVERDPSQQPVQKLKVPLPNPMLAPVIEKFPREPAPIKSIRHASGFPVPGKHKKMIPSPPTLFAPKTISRRKDYDDDDDRIAVDDMGADFDENSRRILSMSQGDILLATKEIQGTFSPDKIKFLMKLGSGAIGPAVKPKQTPMNSTAPGPQKLPNPSEIHNLMDLETAKTHAPPAIKASVAWTLDDDDNDDDTSCTGTQPDPTQSMPQRMLTDRFDLQGAKVSSRDNIRQILRSTLARNSLLKHLGPDALEGLLTQCVDSIYKIGFVVEHRPSDVEPQDELLNHQFERDKPGYNLTEICEVLQHDCSCC